MAETPTRTRPRPLYLRWLDSVRHVDGWSSQDEWKEITTYDTMVHHSIGYLIHEDEHMVVIAQNISEITEPEITAVGIMQIPAVCIIKRKWVADPRV